MAQGFLKSHRHFGLVQSIGGPRNKHVENSLKRRLYYSAADISFPCAHGLSRPTPPASKNPHAWCAIGHPAKDMLSIGARSLMLVGGDQRQ